MKKKNNKTEKKYPRQARYLARKKQNGYKTKTMLIPVGIETELEQSRQNLVERQERIHRIFASCMD